MPLPRTHTDNGGFLSLSRFGTTYAEPVASAGQSPRATYQPFKRTIPMTNLRTFSAPILSAIAAFALSFTLISNTVVSPVEANALAASTSANAAYSA